MRILDVTHISTRGSSYRITLPRKVMKKLGLAEDDFLTFIEDGGRIYIEPLKSER